MYPCKKIIRDSDAVIANRGAITAIAMQLKQIALAIAKR